MIKDASITDGKYLTIVTDECTYHVQLKKLASGCTNDEYKITISFVDGTFVTTNPDYIQFI